MTSKQKNRNWSKVSWKGEQGEPKCGVEDEEDPAQHAQPEVCWGERFFTKSRQIIIGSKL